MEFENKDSKTPVDPTPVSAADQLVGEGKPFKDIEALASGKQEADRFIEQLKRESAEQRDAIAKLEKERLEAATISQVLEAIKGQTSERPFHDPASSGEKIETGNLPGLTEDDILKAIEDKLNAREIAHAQSRNFSEVRDAFSQKWEDPDVARLEYKAAAKRLDISEQELDALSRKNPTLVLMAAGLAGSDASPASPSYLATNENSDASGGKKQGEHRNRSWWNEQRRAKGNSWYFQPSVQNQMWKDVEALGDSFDS